MKPNPEYAGALTIKELGKQPEKLPTAVTPACDESTHLLNLLQSRNKFESLLSP